VWCGVGQAICRDGGAAHGAKGRNKQRRMKERQNVIHPRGTNSAWWYNRRPARQNRPGMAGAGRVLLDNQQAGRAKGSACFSSKPTACQVTEEKKGSTAAACRMVGRKEARTCPGSSPPHPHSRPEICRDGTPVLTHVYAARDMPRAGGAPGR